ncbi:MAG: class I SAM-dependent methyltransferase [Candidatus Zixiibacteriota bacterium]|nr:MAG: class I SAM-dependent methyltransferase [candidate division Zixibacteria bacterium]
MAWTELKDLESATEKCRRYYDAQYSKSSSYWGEQPNLLVPLISSYLRPDSRILVVGCGEGRDAIFLARLDFEVVATEISSFGLKRAKEIVSEENGSLVLLMLDAHEPHDHLGQFDAVLMMNVIQHLSPDLIPDRIGHFKSLVKPGGIFSAQLFTVEDPHFLSAANSAGGFSRRLTIEHPERKYRIRFFEKGELRSYFNGWEMIHYHEGLIWDKPHGVQSDFHQHGMARMIARRRLGI